MNAARKGDVVHLVSCCQSGPRYVSHYRRGEWRCGRCGSNGVDLQVVVLDHDGAVPDPNRDAAGADTPADVSTNRGVIPAVAARG